MKGRITNIIAVFVVSVPDPLFGVNTACRLSTGSGAPNGAGVAPGSATMWMAFSGVGTSQPVPEPTPVCCTKLAPRQELLVASPQETWAVRPPDSWITA